MSAPGVWRTVMRDSSAPARVSVYDLNLLREPIATAHVGAGAITVCWSGSLADDMFARDWGTWGGAGMEALRRFCEGITPGLAARDGRLVLRPHARHVLSDPFKCRRFFDELGEGRIGVALDAASMMEHSMLGEAEGHYERAFEMLGPVASVVFVTGVDRAADEERPPTACAAGQGVVNAGVIGALVRAHVPGGTPLLLMGADAGGQLAALGLGH